MFLEILKGLVERKQSQVHPRYSWASNALAVSDVNYHGIMNGGRSASLLVSGAAWIARHYTEPEIFVWDKRPDGTIVPYTGNGSNQFYDLYENPNPWFTGIELEMSAVTDLIFDGNVYIRKVRANGPDSEVAQLWWCPSWTIEPKWDQENPRSFIDHFLYKPDPTLDGIKIRPEDMIHVTWFRDPLNPRKGISPVKHLLREVYSDEKAANFVASLLRNMGMPGIILSPKDNETTEPMSIEDAAATKQQFMNVASGDQAGSVIVMDAAMQIDKLTFSPDELDLSKLREVSERRVASALGLYAEVLGFGAGSDASDFTEMLETSYQSTVMFIQRLFAAKLKKDLLGEYIGRQRLRRLVVAYDNTNVQILSRLMNEKAKRYGLGVLYGWTEVAEARFEFGMPVRDEDRIYLRRKGTYAVRENDVLEESIPDGDPDSGGDGLSDGPAESPETEVEMASMLPIIIETPEELSELVGAGITRRNGNHDI